MKATYLRKNLKATKRELKLLAHDLKVRLKWENDPKKPKIYLTFTKQTRHATYIKIIFLPEDKIAYGKYKPSMVAYNVERQLTKWLSYIYEENYS